MPESAVTSRHFTIGTAGHVDHGKTSLIRALTGTDTDRLQEEQERGMSIDLGFADFRLPSGRHAGVIDVPGHERFLKNMLAGAGGIDLVLLVIAADEGVMPQTREHLDILNLLQTRRGVIVLTKCDLVDDDWLALVREETREALRGTFLADAPLLPVSSTTGAGLSDLAGLLDRLADDTPHRTLLGPWRLPIDRAFTIGGFGTVVTGTLTAGIARLGDRVAILPEGRESRIRSLQVHGAAVTSAEAGSRVAMNLAGVDVGQVDRGHVAAPPGALRSTLALDARLEVLPGSPRVVKHRSRVRVYLGAAEVLARLNLLDAESLAPGESGLVQLRLECPTAAARGDRFVLRFYSPLETLGGGVIIDPQPERRHRRFEASALASLGVKERGTPEDLVAESIQRHGLRPVTPAALAQELGRPADEVAGFIATLEERGEVVRLDRDGVAHLHRLRAAEAQALEALEAFHTTQPMRLGMSREELRSRLTRWMDARGFSLVLGRLEAAGQVCVEGARVRLAGRQPQLTEAQRRVADALEEGLRRDPFNAPFLEDLLTATGLAAATATPVWEALADNGTIIRITAGVFLHREAVDEATTRVTEYLREHGRMTAAEFRDLLGTTRKYAVPLMEYLDAQHVTRRVGDFRELY